MRFSRFRSFSKVFAILGLATCCGCGGVADAPNVYPVTGKVTKGGQPVANVIVNFNPTDAEGALPSSAVTDSTGAYTLKRHTGDDGAIPGSYKVTLADNTAAPSASSYQNAGSGPPKAAESSIPEQYQSVEKTTLRFDVKAEPNVYDIKLD